MTVLEEILFIKGQTVAELSEAAKTPDAGRLVTLSQRLAQLDLLSKKAESVAKKLTLIKADMSGRSPVAGHSLRHIEIRITGGMIRTHMLIVTPYTGQIDYGEKMLVSAPFEEPNVSTTFETEFVKTGNRLKARGEIRRFYKVNEVVEDDTVVLYESAPGQWALETKTAFDRLQAEPPDDAPVPAAPAPSPEDVSPKAATKPRQAPVKQRNDIPEA